MPSLVNESERHLRRHELVYLAPEGWCELLGMRTDLAGDPLLASWVDNGWPLIARRAVPGECPGVALGLPLPPFAGKRRIQVVLRPEDIRSVSSPPALARVVPIAPRHWLSTLARLELLAVRNDLEARVFGSFAWQFLTGLQYVAAGSDLDVLLHLRPDTDMRTLVQELAAIDDDAPMRIDGELVRQDGAAVNWRELYGGVSDVLVKSADGIAQRDADSFLARGLR